MSDCFEVRHVSIAIQRPVRAVYEYVSNGEHLPLWAGGLCERVERSGEDWIGHGSLGQIRIHFAVQNELGVLDHDVQLPDGKSVHNPLRVVPNGAGSELTFTLFRLPGVTEQAFASDAAAVERDLKRLKASLEA